MPKHFATVLAVLFCAAVSPAAFALRYVGAEIRVDGQVVLEGGYGDDGHPGPDAVWASLPSIGLRTTKHFVAYHSPDDPDVLVLRPSVKGTWIEVEMPYGGLAEVEELRLVRVFEESDRRWKLHPAEFPALTEVRRRPAYGPRNYEPSRRVPKVDLIVGLCASLAFAAFGVRQLYNIGRLGGRHLG